MNYYKAFYNGKHADIRAGNSNEALMKANEHFQVPKDKLHLVSIMLLAMVDDFNENQTVPRYDPSNVKPEKQYKVIKIIPPNSFN